MGSSKTILEIVAVDRNNNTALYCCFELPGDIDPSLMKFEEP